MALDNASQATGDRLNRSELEHTGSLMESLDMTPGTGVSSGETYRMPIAPVHFPLREALMNLQASAQGPPSARTAMAQAQTAGQVGPYKVHNTEKTRAQKKIGRMKRRGEHLQWGYAEERPLLTPRAPEECDRPKSAPKSVPSAATRTRVGMLKLAETAGQSGWPVIEKSQSAPDLHAGPSVMSGTSAGGSGTTMSDIRPTWTSAARAVLGHTRRAATEKRKGHDQGGDSSQEEPQGELAGLSMDSSWCGMSLASNRFIPKPVKDWASKGLEFTDGGMGIGDRFDLEIKNLARRSPGFVYEQQKYGSVGLWKSQASQPSKQSESRHFSAETHRMGARRDPQRRHERRPDPGHYELPGFTDELLRNIAKRPGKRATAAKH